MQPDGYMSFLVRLWTTQHSPNGEGGWCGEVEHVQSGNRWNFATLDEVLAFLQHTTGSTSQVKRADGSESAGSMTIKEQL